MNNGRQDLATLVGKFVVERRARIARVLDTSAVTKATCASATDYTTGMAPERLEAGFVYCVRTNGGHTALLWITQVLDPAGGALRFVLTIYLWT